MHAFELQAGDTFRFRTHSRWQFWRRRWGGAQFVSSEPGGEVLHLRVFGMDGSVISHLPIVASCVMPYIVEVYERAPIDPGSHSAIAEWRNEVAAGGVGAFNVPLFESIALVESVLPPDVGANIYVVESAYPVANDGDALTSVRVIVA